MRLIDADTLPVKFDGHTISVWKNDLDAAPTIHPFEWISTEERLPPCDEDDLIVCNVIVKVGNEYYVDLADWVKSYNYITKEYSHHWVTMIDWDEGQGCEVKYWMPLPKIDGINIKEV